MPLWTVVTQKVSGARAWYGQKASVHGAVIPAVMRACLDWFKDFWR
jgi:hypothetical protein